MFEESIGDIEEVLGERVQRMIVAALNPYLSEDERTFQLEQDALAIQNHIAQQRELEESAADAGPMRDHLLQVIRAGHDRGRYLQPGELLDFVRDFLRQRYRGVVVRPVAEAASRLELSLPDDARRELEVHLARSRTDARTRLTARQGEPVVCCFDPRDPARNERQHEAVTHLHPLIRWIRDELQQDPAALRGVTQLELEAGEQTPPGRYVFLVMAWRFEALRRERILVFVAFELDSGRALDRDDAEALVAGALRSGRSPESSRPLATRPECERGFEACVESFGGAYVERRESFIAENDATIDQLLLGLRRRLERHEREFEEEAAKIELRLFWLSDEEQRQKLQRSRQALQGVLTRHRNEALQRTRELEDKKRLTCASFEEIAAGVIHARGRR